MRRLTFFLLTLFVVFAAVGQNKVTVTRETHDPNETTAVAYGGQHYRLVNPNSDGAIIPYNRLDAHYKNWESGYKIQACRS